MFSLLCYVALVLYLYVLANLTPRPGADFKDGAGLLTADALYKMCDAGNGDFGLVPIGLDQGSVLPSGDTPYKTGWAPPGETQALDLSPQAFDTVPGSAGLVGERLLLLPLQPGDRLRATWSWYACAMTNAGTAPASVSVDYDLFLYRQDGSGGTYVWASQSFDDNNEGIDYTVPAGHGGKYHLYVAWPDEALSCTG